MYQRLSKVRFTLERQGRRYLVVDGCAHFGMVAATPTRLMVMRNVPTAVLVDGIERMHDIGMVHSLPAAFQGEERHWYRGLAVLKGRVVPVVNADAFLSRAEFTLLDSHLTPALEMMAASV
jgi:CheW-like domain.